MIIGQAAKASGLPPKTIRYYETIGLVKSDRTRNGYRDYADAHVQRLNTIRCARSLGFSIDECRDLLSLFEDKNRPVAEVERIVQAWITELDKKSEELREMRSSLARLVAACSDNPSDRVIQDDFVNCLTGRH